MPGSVTQYVSFDLDGSLYGLDIRTVKEVTPVARIAPVPRSSRHIRGLVNIRGQVVLVLDIAVIFGREPRPVLPTSQIVILKTTQEIRRMRDTNGQFAPERFSDKPVGFLVDAIGDVVAVEGDNTAPAPPHLGERNARYVEGVARRQDRLLIVLKVVELLT